MFRIILIIFLVLVLVFLSMITKMSQESYSNVYLDHFTNDTKPKLCPCSVDATKDTNTNNDDLYLKRLMERLNIWLRKLHNKENDINTIRAFYTELSKYEVCLKLHNSGSPEKIEKLRRTINKLLYIKYIIGNTISYYDVDFKYHEKKITNIPDIIIDKNTLVYKCDLLKNEDNNTFISNSGLNPSEYDYQNPQSICARIINYLFPYKGPQNNHINCMLSKQSYLENMELIKEYKYVQLLTRNLQEYNHANLNSIDFTELIPTVVQSMHKPIKYIIRSIYDLANMLMILAKHKRIKEIKSIIYSKSLNINCHDIGKYMLIEDLKRIN